MTEVQMLLTLLAVAGLMALVIFWPDRRRD